jgi:hypothetical protein
MHSIKEVDMNQHAKRVEHYEKMSAQETFKAMDSHMTCEVRENIGHLGNVCPKTHEDLNFVSNDNGFCPQQH